MHGEVFAWFEGKTAKENLKPKELTYDMEPLFAGPFEVRYVPNSSHWVQQEQPQLVNRYLLEFLAGRDPRP